MNRHDEAFGEDRLLAFLDQKKALPIDALLARLLEEVRSWRGQTEFGDDLSLLGIEIT
jgi:serine phosphatase RsbU (regulator of sigma subunit)